MFQSAFACLIRAAKMGGFGRLLQDGSKLRVVALYENMERRTDEFRRYLNDLCNSLKVLRLREMIPLLIDFMDILRGYQDAAKRACSSSTASVFGIERRKWARDVASIMKTSTDGLRLPCAPRRLPTASARSTISGLRRGWESMLKSSPQKASTVSASAIRVGPR